ncbi:hypothetical protein COU59_02630 [Candidatus Pacearchaeota archaeon CG10_big_fil_rev_8_21_14_0_10_34_12]|nr:MAG: hypothetical protein COU59_02630 [Candidatus Pacearchaeota archaeon CG10_big_fil_rev_8_21_14_0_10_34_12]
MKRRKSKKKEENFLKKNYSESWNYIKDSRKFIYSIFWIFVLFIVLALVIPIPTSLENQLRNFIEQLLMQTEGLSWFGLIKFIFLNNVQSSFSGMIFGAVLGIFSVLTAIVNGYIIGFVSLIVVREAGISVLWKLLPHGIFELPALFISLGLGLKMGTFIFQKKKVESFKNYLINSLKVFAFVVIPLLVVAAIIEGTLIFFVG